MRLLLIGIASLLWGASQPVQATADEPLETRPKNATNLEPAFSGQTRAPEVRAGVTFRTEVVATGLNKPWGMTFLPDGRLLITERTGLRIVTPAGEVSDPISGAPAVDTGDQGGVHDVVLDPDYADNGWIYFTFSEPGEPPLTSSAVARARLSEREGAPALEDLTIIFSQQPKLDSRQHYGGRLAFDNQARLYVTTGERYVPVGRPQAQHLDSLLGKVVRINRDGGVPADNPFVGRADARPEIWSYGHRNVQGAAIHPVTGRLWINEHGPRGGDELNIPEAGGNYGWPIISYGIEYTGEAIGAGLTQAEGMMQPIYYWDPVIAPSGMAFYESDAAPEWKGSLFIAALAGKHLARLTLDGDRVVGEERLLIEGAQRLRDVEVGPDGAVWVLTEGARDASLIKLTPNR